MNIDYIRACVAKWIVAYIATPVHPTAVLSLCVQTAKMYNEKLEEQKQ